jgi:hypothetical protein
MLCAVQKSHEPSVKVVTNIFEVFAMPAGDGLRQDDINYLFSLSHGELMSMPMASADRLMAQDLVEPVGSPDGAKVSGMTNYHVGITRRGRGMVSAVQMGRESRFVEPRP